MMNRGIISHIDAASVTESASDKIILHSVSVSSPTMACSVERDIEDQNQPEIKF